MRPAVLTDAPLAELIPELWNPVQQSRESRSAVEEEIAVRMPTGAEKVALCRVEPIIREGRALGSVVILSDRSSAPTRERSRTAMRSPGSGPAKYTFEDILGNSPVLSETLNVARAAAHTPHQKPVLLVGESGTGKELVAHAIHAESRRASGPFIAVDCGALPRELVESELFGYAPGAFTGARREGQAGKFEAAHGGTLFLDEIDSLPMELQGARPRCPLTSASWRPAAWIFAGASRREHFVSTSTTGSA
jgi:transcriptional regulator with PAS, ATPase and Fis domain